MDTIYDALVIGGGFYGCITALYLHEQGYRVLIVEREADLLTRASYVNQARVHNGYHYPRSFMTAWRSLVNFPRFVRDFHGCIDNSFEKVYAIARRNSKVNPYQFKQFCHNIGAPINIAPPQIKRLFNPDLIAEVFVVKEYAFNAVRLRELMRQRLERASIPIAYHTETRRIACQESGLLTLELGNGTRLKSRYVFNCTYAQLNVLLQASDLTLLPLKHQIAEMALVDVPDPLKGLGITVMDGPFFSVMPFPADGLYSLSHVRYTHHETWFDDGTRNPYAYLAEQPVHTNVAYMLRDAQRYLPALAQARYERSLFDIKTLLLRNEIDDGRPILFHESYDLPRLYSVMGGKIDNIYDLIQNMQHFTRKLPSSEESSVWTKTI